MWGSVDVTTLRVLHALAEQGTVTAAARTLGISQPAVSQVIRRTERRLGTAVVVRAGRKLRLTEAGQVLARHGETVTAALQAADGQIQALTSLQAGTVRLVAFPSSSATLLPVALAHLREQFPQLTVTFDEIEPPDSLHRLRAGDYDLAIAFSYPGTDLGRGEDDLTGLVTVHLLDDPTFAVLAHDHPLADAPNLTLEDLDEQTWIAGCPRCRGQLLSSCHTAGYQPQIAYATDDYVTVLGLVAAGLGVALLPGLVRGFAACAPGVVIRDVDTAPRRVFAVTTPELLQVPAVKTTLAALTRAAQQRR